MAVAADQEQIVRDRLYIGGEWVDSCGDGQIDVVNCATERVMGSVPQACAADVELAVAAARGAFEAWSDTSVGERASYLDRIADGLAQRAQELGELIAREVGMPVGLAKRIQAGLPVADFKAQAAAVAEFDWELTLANSLVLHEPVGVVAAIAPWNYPLHQVAAKVAPALAAGCTVVVKPSELAPLSIFVLAEVVDEVGLPAGVFNLVTGFGPVVGEALAASSDVDMLSFTGSTAAGRRVSELASASVKRVTLELGGKSANVILDDADFERAVSHGVGACFLNSGQTCSALTRMLVPRERLADVERIAAGAAERFTPGDPFEPTTKLGPLVSARQRERVRGYIEQGLAEGARLVTGGAEPPEGLSAGYFVRPTVFSDVTSEMTIAQEEIFGPVLVVMPYDDEQDAVRIANDTIYGLAGGVWSADEGRAKRVARQLRTGQVDINGGAYNPLAPFGGYKQSGNGRELGPYALHEFLELKSLQL